MSDRYPGGFIKAVPDEPTEYTAPGIWTLEQAAVYKKAGKWPLTSDPYFNQTTLLLHGDGSGQELCFEDNSSNDFPITVNGDAYGTPFSPYNTSWSNYFDGTGDYLSVASSADFGFGTGDFTMECWIYPFLVPTTYVGLISTLASSPAVGVSLCTDSAGNITFSINNASAAVFTANTTSTKYAANTWQHIAITRESGTVKIWLNGSQIGTNKTDTGDCGATDDAVVGRLYTQFDDFYFDGYISNLRIVKGTAVYTSAFTPSTAPLTAISGTSLLTCQTNRFVDNSGTPKTITVNGNTAVKSLSPFAETDTTTGSGYFDGSGDYIALPDSSISLGSGDCAIDFWCYITGEPTLNPFLFDNLGNSSARLYAYYDGTTMYLNADGIVRTTTFVYNQWNYFQFTRTSGTGGWYLNGSLISTTAASTGTINLQRMTIGAAEESGTANPSQWTQGYISSFRASTTNRSTTVPTAPDTSDANTSLLTCQYRNAVRNVGFIDSSPNKFLITRNGNTTQGSFSPFSVADGTWSNYFDGTTDYLDTDSTLKDLSTGDFCIQFWIYTSATSAMVIDTRTGLNAGWMVYIDTTIRFYHASTTRVAGAIQLNAWNHIAITRSSGTLRLFVNGTQEDSTTYTTDLSDGDDFRIGYKTNSASTVSDLNGYLSNLSVVIGSAIYTSGFTPSTTPLSPSTTNQKLLTCYSNRFVDANTATTAKTITPAGNTSVQPFSPFAPSAAYSASVNGGSGYWDNDGDRLEVASNPAFNLSTNNFTYQLWYYPLGAATTDYLILHNGFTNGFWMYTTTQKKIAVGLGNADRFTTTGGWELNAWNFIQFTRSGTTLSLYINGVLAGATSVSATVNAGPISIGAYGNAYTVTGYLSDVRLVTGSALSATVPTEPLTAIANTQLLCNFTNAGIFDNTGKNNLETVGNAQVDTSVVKYGQGSMKFDGTGDGLSIRSNDNLAFGTGDWTVEFWVYHTSISGQQTYISDTFGNTNGPYIYKDGSNKIGLYYSSQILTATNAISATTWYHVAVCRGSGTVRLFINGVEEASTSDSTNLSVPIQWIGADTNSAYFNGYLDDLRITKGVARYTANFTPPGGPFLNK